MSSASDFIEYTIGHPDKFVVRVREIVETPKPFPLILRFTGSPDATGGRLRIEVVIDPARSTIPIRLVTAKNESQRTAPPRADAVHSLNQLIREYSAIPQAVTPPPPPAPAERKPKVCVGETLRLF